MANNKPTSREWGRKALHIALGLMLVPLLHLGLLDTWGVFYLLVVGILLSWAAQAWRLPLFGWLLENFERPSAVTPGSGVLTYLVGVILAVKLFPPEVAYAAILILALGDGVSSLVGPYGRLRTRLSETKLLEGTLAGAACGAAGASFFLTPLEAGVAAAAAMIFETMELRLNRQLLDDNVIVPLVAGTAVLLLRKFGVA
jgi:dolichol kinase